MLVNIECSSCGRFAFCLSSRCQLDIVAQSPFYRLRFERFDVFVNVDLCLILFASLCHILNYFHSSIHVSECVELVGIRDIMVFCHLGCCGRCTGNL